MLASTGPKLRIALAAGLLALPLAAGCGGEQGEGDNRGEAGSMKPPGLKNESERMPLTPPPAGAADPGHTGRAAG